MSKTWDIAGKDDIAMIGQFRHVILFDTADQAKWYLDNCYDHWPRIIVMSTDGVYPKNNTLKRAVQHNWVSNSELIVLVMGWHSLQNMPQPATKAIFTLDRWIVDSCRDRDDSIYSELAIDWNPVKLSRIIRCLCETVTTRNTGFGYRGVKSEMYDFDKLPEWLVDLIK